MKEKTKLRYGSAAISCVFELDDSGAEVVVRNFSSVATLIVLANHSFHISQVPLTVCSSVQPVSTKRAHENLEKLKQMSWFAGNRTQLQKDDSVE